MDEIIEVPHDVLAFLDRLRESGATNMYGGAPYLVETFDVDIRLARKYLKYWMDTFATRHKLTK